MKAEKKILIAFLLNLIFSVFEFAGGLLTGSTAILSDAVHDIGDAASIGISYLLEKKSHMPPDSRYTYGYTRYSVLGGIITSVVLLLGSLLVIWKAIVKMITPTALHYDGMLLLAVVGVCVNFCAVLFTRGSAAPNQKAVNLHMLEDVLGWMVVLIGTVIMRLTDLVILDPLMSVGVAGFILFHAVENLKEALELFLEKAPRGMDTKEVRQRISSLEGVLDVYHIHLWSADGIRSYATMHVVVNGEVCGLKEKIRRELHEYGIEHATLEFEGESECGSSVCCCVEARNDSHHRHHHHH